MALSSDSDYLNKLRLQYQQANAVTTQSTGADTSINEKGTSAGSAKTDILTISTSIPSLGGSFAITVPLLPSPTGSASHVDMSKQLALFRQDTQNTAYKSQRNRMQGDALINDLKNMAAAGQVLNNIEAYAKVIDINTLFTLTAVEAEQAVENAKAKGLQNQLAQIEELQKQLEGLGDFDKKLQIAEKNAQQALTTANNADKLVTGTQQSVDRAQIELDSKDKLLQDAMAQLENVKQEAVDHPDQDYTQIIAIAQQNVNNLQNVTNAAQKTYDQAVSALSFAKTEASKAHNALGTAQSELTKAQATAKTAADLTEKIAAARQAIEQGTYAISVTEALPKINELYSSSASYIEKLAEINPKLALPNTFLNELGIQPQSGVSITESLTSELSSRLRATGMSATEAAATASLIVSGGNMEALTLPKTTVDVIQQFNNDVKQATQNSLDKLKNSFDLSAPKPTPETSKIRDNLKLLHQVMDTLMPEAKLKEEDSITAFLVAMGKAIDEMCELQDKLYEERIAIEKELKNHAHI